MGGFVSQRRVEFRDTDMAGIVHFSVFFVWMEQAEHAALRHVGLSVHPTSAEPLITWPRVAAQCEYHAPAHFEDVLQVELRVQKLGRKSVAYAVSFTCDDRLVASGQLTAVCCQRTAAGPLQSIPIPLEIADKLRHLL